MTTAVDSDVRAALIERYRAVRAQTERLAAPLSPEDQQLQSQTSSSPAKWHRAHTTWFFETFVLVPRGVPVHDERWPFLFNSYYEAAGPRHERPRRGMVSRPTAAEVSEYRRTVDARLAELVERAGDDELGELAQLIELGVNHEQQHQELLLTDILHAFSCNPLRPAYRAQGAPPTRAGVSPAPLGYLEHPGGVVEIGAPADSGFIYDNEGPRHRVFLEPFAIADRLVTVGEMKAFIEANGYRTSSLWLSEGMEWVRAEGIEAPLYARYADGVYTVFGLDGERVAADDEPVAHLSFYEADALARFLDARLPTEQEWETFAAPLDAAAGNFVDDEALRPLPRAAGGAAPAQLFGDLWEWTRSSYEPYPGYRPVEGALGEYNGKWMINQQVLRGGSCFTPRGHVRATYRNFWHPVTRFQMAGLRTARSL